MIDLDLLELRLEAAGITKVMLGWPDERPLMERFGLVPSAIRGVPYDRAAQWKESTFSLTDRERRLEAIRNDLSGLTASERLADARREKP